ncbi:MAG TPA: hypothetical protein VEL11_05665 [Candidatus Bathyarchaeia archaeon]|nr:hypothetical protein [Candidatus Bathyarchaeia archaeon]
MDIFPDVWEELGESIMNLIISNYRSVFRSLRWIIAFWIDLELDKNINGVMSYFRKISFSVVDILACFEFILKKKMILNRAIVRR